MVSIASLWLPILVAAILVFGASAVIWMVLPWHESDFEGLDREDDVRRALADVPPGQYHIPHSPTREDYDSPEMEEKFEEGPVGFLTIVDRGKPAMGKQFVQWFLFSVVVGIFCAYVAGRTLGPGAEYLSVFRVTGTVAFLSYGMAYVQEGVWFGRPWSFVWKQLLDGLVYGLLTAGAFGWLWPGM